MAPELALATEMRRWTAMYGTKGLEHLEPFIRGAIAGLLSAVIHSGLLSGYDELHRAVQEALLRGVAAAETARRALQHIASERQKRRVDTSSR